MAEATALKSLFQELVQPFIDAANAPRALWGVNLGYLLEGMVYFGMLNYLAMYFNEYLGYDDVQAGRRVGILTAGITISMFALGGVADRKGVRTSLILSFVFLLAGRILLSTAPGIGGSTGFFSPMHMLAISGILVVVIGYGMYQPAAYAAVRQFTTPAMAGMAFAMLYALMNLGGWLPSFFAPIRRALGISGAFWIYTALTAVSLVATVVLLSKRTVSQAIEAAQKKPAPPQLDAEHRIDADFVCSGCGYNLRTIHVGASCPECNVLVQESIDKFMASSLRRQAAAPAKKFSLKEWLRSHPLLDPRFSFFIFCLIPVQTLFAHNWLTLPMYVARAFRGSWIGRNFEFATNLNPLLIFVLVPVVAAVTQKAKVYNLMIVGTLIMAVPTFFLAAGANAFTLISFLVFMTLGEAFWQPRFLQYAAEIAPEGRTGSYMGVAQLPWFLTKTLVPLYSGWFLKRYCPPQGEVHSERMWFIYACIAMVSPVLLILAKGWVGKDFKTKAA